MNTSLGSNKRGGASADSSAITRMRKLAAIANNYNDPSKQQKFPAGVVSVGLANSALQVVKNVTRGVSIAASPSGRSFSIIPIGLGNTTETLNTFNPSTRPTPTWSAGCYAAYSFTPTATGSYVFTLTPTIQNQVNQVISVFQSGTTIFTEADVIDPANPANLIQVGDATISSPLVFTVSATIGNTYYFAIYSVTSNNFTPQTYTLNIVKV
jgi:hypothetical protein